MLLILGILTSCGNIENKDTVSSINTDTIIKPADKGLVVKRIVDTIPVVSSKQITGIWSTTEKEILTVDISKDSIFYTEHFESHKYEIKKDSIYIHYYDFTFSGRPYLINDTLIISSINGDVKYARIKE